MALFVTHSGAVGGAEVMLGRYLRERPGDHEVLVLGSGPSSDFFASAGAVVRTLPLLDGLDRVSRDLSPVDAALAGPRVARRLRVLSHALRASQHAVVVTNSMKAHVLVPPLACRHGRSVGIRLHDILGVRSASRLARATLARTSRSAVSTAAVSQAAASAARAEGLERVTCFYNGVELGEPHEVRPVGPLRLLVVSQLAAWKGVHHVLEAVARARAEGVALSLDVVGEAIFGDWRYRERLRRLTSQLGLEGTVHWLGQQSDPRPYYRAADVFVHLPEHPDPLPTAVLEAQSWGLPVVASAGGGTGEIVADGETGLLLSGPDPSAAAAAIARVTDATLRRRFAEAARRRVERLFSLSGYVAAFDEWLDSLAATGAQPGGAERWRRALA